MRIKKFMALGLAVITAAVLGGCGKKAKKEEIAVPILEAKEIEYKTCEAEIKDISEKYYKEGAYGYPYYRTVRFSASGQIESIKVQSPVDVKEGDLLATLYTDEVQEQIEREKIRLDQSKQTVATLRANGGTAGEIQMAEYDLQIEQLKYDRLVESLEDYKVYAPCDGEFNISQMEWGREFNVNTPVKEGDTFGVCSDKSREYLCVEVYDDPLSNVNFGTSVTLEQGAKSSTGTVSDIVFVENGDFSAYTYVITPDDKEELFDFGEIQVVFDVYSRQDTVVIPKKAVKELSGRHFVYLLVDGVKIEQDIELGIEDNNNVEVTAGLSGGETIILN